MVSRNKLENKDLNRLGWLSMISQSGFSFERMQAGGFTAAMIPGFEKIYGDQTEEIAAAMTNNMGFVNTEPHMITFLQGLILSLEEAGEERSLIQNLRTGLFGPLAGLGDAIFWFTLLPVSAAIAASFNTQGSVLAPSCCANLVLAPLPEFGLKIGLTLMLNSLSLLKKAARRYQAAGYFGCHGIGVLSRLTSRPALSIRFILFGTVPVQGIFDTILKNILPLGFVMLVYYILKVKKVSVVKVILGVIVASVLLAFLGIL